MTIFSSVSSIDECPDFLKHNTHIISGYRINFTQTHCIKSLFMLTNETVNIWSHLLGALYFCVVIIHLNFYHLPSYEETRTADYLVMTSFCVAFLTCLLLSSLYHTFNCVSEHSFRVWLNQDRFGITLGILGCYIPAIYYGFYCMRLLKAFYTCSVICLIVFIVSYQIQSRQRKKKNDAVIIIFYMLIAFFGVVPTMHFVALQGFLNPIVIVFVPKIFVMYLLVLAGYFFYRTKFPEKLLPGWFDYIGASHQLWHVFVFFAMLWWYHTSVSLMLKRILDKETCKFES